MATVDKEKKAKPKNAKTKKKVKKKAKTKVTKKTKVKEIIETKIDKRKLKRIDFKIIITKDNKQKKFIGYYMNEKCAYKAFNKFIEDNKNVKIPIEITTESIAKPISYEVILLKRKQDSDVSNNKFKNKYGEYVEYETNSDSWIVYDKIPYLIEEKFWVFGYSPQNQRKDIFWIYENLIAKYATAKENFLNIYLFKNKILFDTTNKLNLVICKTIGDAIRLYNQLECDFKNDKTLKHAIFTGDANTSYIRKKICLQKIKELTDWDMDHLYRNSTRRNVTEYRK